MAADSGRPICFLAAPFGKRAPPGRRKPLIDFNRVHAHLAAGVRLAGLDPVRADFEPSGGFIHKATLERLLVAEYVVADLTLSNPTVLYAVGVRDGASRRPTLLVSADRFVPELIVDLQPLRLLTYALRPDGTIAKSEGTKLADRVREQLALARDGRLPADNPIVQVTSWRFPGDVDHSKTDVFLDRVRFQGETGEGIRAAIALRDDDAAVQRLSEIEARVVRPAAGFAQPHTALLGLFLGYREKRAYGRMVALFERFPEELKQTPVAREQLALALNRLAETATQSAEAEGLRGRALAVLEAIDDRSVTSETLAIRGRIYKGWHTALQAGGATAAPRAAAMLQKAVEAYEQGFRSDIRDYYPGVNAVTLRLTRGTAEDRLALRTLLPVVRYSVDAARPPKNAVERYWQTATRLELAAADRDWESARRQAQELAALDAQSWMRETTAGNLRRQQQALGGDDARRLAELIAIIAD